MLTETRFGAGPVGDGEGVFFVGVRVSEGGPVAVGVFVALEAEGLGVGLTQTRIEDELSDGRTLTEVAEGLGIDVQATPQVTPKGG